MNKYTKTNLILLAVLAIAVFTAGCDDPKVIEANKLVDSANAKVNEAKPLVTKTANTFEKILDGLDDFPASKKAQETEHKELLANYDKIAELYKGAIADFGQAAKLSSDETFKAYYEMSVKDLENTAALGNQNRLLTQAYFDSKTTDEFAGKIAEIKTKNDSLTKEGDEITAKLKTLEEAVKAKNK